MTTSFEIKGKWKLPNTDEVFEGTLNFDPEKGARLELHGTIAKNLPWWSKIDIIIGETTEGKITLIDCHPKSIRDSYSAVTLSIYKPIYIIEGYHFANKNEISFRNVKFCALNLFQWLDISGSESNYRIKPDDFSFTFNKPNNIPLELNETLKGYISFDCTIKEDQIDNKLEIQEQCYMNLNYETKTNFLKIIDDITYFLGFVSLVTYEQSYPICIDLSDDDYNKQEFPNKYPFNRLNKPIRCFYTNSLYHNNRNFNKTNEQLVKYDEIQNIFPIVLKNWYENYSELEPVFELLLYTIRNKNKFGVENFMDITRAIETFHRRTQNLTIRSNEDYDKLVSNILSKVELSKTDLNWLKGKLEYGNEPSLKRRLEDLINKYSNNLINDRIKPDKKFTQSIVDSRNYYTHFDIRNEKKALRDKDLFVANQKLMVLLISCIFKHIGLDNSHFEEGLEERFTRHLA